MSPAPSIAHPALLGLKLAMLGLSLGLLAACEGDGQSRDPGPVGPDSTYAEQAAELFGDSPKAQSDGAAAAWTIVLAKLGDDDPRIAQTALAHAQSSLGTGPWIQQRGGHPVLVFGRYPGSELEAAAVDLRRVRSTRVDGVFPYLFAVLAPPPSEELEGTSAEGDLRKARATYGRAAIYTLQIGVYGRADGQPPSDDDILAFRQAAETAVAQLRLQGETAFYYHDPIRSMVTIGVFGVRDHDPSTTPATETSRLSQTRERHPLNLLNGQGIRESHPTEGGGRYLRMQPSTLVMIPEK